MKAVIHGNSGGIQVFNTLTVDELLRAFAEFFYIRVSDQATKDWLDGYALVSGIRTHVLTLEDPLPHPNRGSVTVTFPELEL